MKTAKVKRKTFVARVDLIDRLSEKAKQRGFSLYDTVNEVFELALRAEETGVDLRKVVEEKAVLEAAKKAGFILGLESLWYEMAEIVYEKAKSRAIKSWFEAGEWVAKRYVTGEVKDPFEAFQKDLEAFTWNVAELAIKRAGDKVSVRIISPRFSESYTIMFASFIEGAIKALRYKIAVKEVYRGAIRLEAGKEAHV